MSIMNYIASVYINYSSKNLQEIIEKSICDLQNKKLVTNVFCDAVIKGLANYCENFSVAPYVIVPHARPEEGINKSSISIVLSKVVLHHKSSSDGIKLIIIVAAKTTDEHLKIFMELSKILNDNTCLKKIIKSKNAKDLLKNLNECLIIQKGEINVRKNIN